MMDSRSLPEEDDCGRVALLAGNLQDPELSYSPEDDRGEAVKGGGDGGSILRPSSLRDSELLCVELRGRPSPIRVLSTVHCEQCIKAGKRSEMAEIRGGSRVAVDGGGTVIVKGGMLLRDNLAGQNGAGTLPVDVVGGNSVGMGEAGRLEVGAACDNKYGGKGMSGDQILKRIGRGGRDRVYSEYMVKEEVGIESKQSLVFS